MGRILVAVDLSDASIEVLREARLLANARGATLAVVHVVPYVSDVQPFFPQNYGMDIARAVELEKNLQQAFERRVSEIEGCADIERFFERGSAYAEIVRRAEAWRADLLMVGSRGHTGLSRALLGSVAERVVRHAHCPVLVSRPGRPTGVVMAATDLSDPSLPAVAKAAEEAKLRGARLIVAHAVDDRFAMYGASAGALFGGTVPLAPPEVQAELRATLMKLLREATERFDPNGEAVIFEGGAAAAIVRAIEERGAELLVVGTHGRTGLSRLLLGSVAEEIVRHASCSVLVVRQVEPH